MKRVYIPEPGSGLTWAERLELRKHALKCAVKVQSGATSTTIILEKAREFEKYLENG